MKIGDPILIKYHKTDTTEEPHVRAIVPLTVPIPSSAMVTAIEISNSLANRQYTECLEVAKKVSEYQKYKQQQMSQILTFDAWRDLTYQDTTPLVYRSFKVDKIETVAE